jgi:hypothetical protein
LEVEVKPIVTRQFDSDWRGVRRYTERRIRERTWYMECKNET